MQVKRDWWLTAGERQRGYLVNNGDLATCDIDREEESGRLTEVTTSQAKEFIKDL